MVSGSHSSTARAILYAFVANFGIAIAKTWAAWLTGSGSMLAEAIHSYADTGNQVLLYLGLKQSQRPPDAEHPLGYGKLSYFWSFIVAILLFTLGGMFSIYEGIHKFNHPEELSKVWIAIVVLVLAILLEGGSLLGCLREIKKVRGERPFGEWFKHTRNSELVVVLGEDIGAQLGLFLALGFLITALVTGNPVYDAMGSMCIGVILLVISVFIAWRIKALLVGRSADPEIQEAIDDVIAEQDSIVHVFNTITIQYGPDTMLAAKIKLKDGITIDAAVRDINELERKLKARIPNLKWLFIEPDVSD
ncbi:MAG: cation diffusion facilitator family transporter [Woeseiaceae bacterium]|nr:cation diffusion facilitator family transporter [Woeseiaceae bacterium]